MRDPAKRVDFYLLDILPLAERIVAALTALKASIEEDPNLWRELDSQTGGALVARFGAPSVAFQDATAVKVISALVISSEGWSEATTRVVVVEPSTEPEVRH